MKPNQCPFLTKNKASWGSIGWVGLPLNYDNKTNTLPETNSLHLKMDGRNTSFLFGWPISRCYISFREGTKPFFCLNMSRCFFWGVIGSWGVPLLSR